MIRGLTTLVQPLLGAIDPERAHGLALGALRAGLFPCANGAGDPRLQVRLWDLDFPNPLGMAAGFDKDAEVPDALIAAGFGFAEVGTVTPRPQAGNPRPRVFRLPADRAVINRLGFNSAGHAAAARRLAARQGPGIVGVNVGANRDSEDRIADYVAGVATFARNAAYLTINVSSPNTPGLRELQAGDAIDELLARVVTARDAETAPLNRRVPLLLKIAPDLDEPGLDAIAGAVERHGIDGVIVSNTTLARDGLTDRNARESGGLSGRPLFSRATAVLARMHLRLGPNVPLIGVGGVDSGAAAYEKIRAGAHLVQLYTGLVYEGLELVGAINRDLSRRLRRDGHATIADAAGSGAREWAEEAI